MNTNELIINGKDAWTTYRVKMGNGFLDALEADADNKSYITNEVRTEHGTRVVPIRPKKAERSITLEFVIVGRDHSDYNKRVKAFDYSRGKGGAIGKKSLKFIEYNPTNRGVLTDFDINMFTLKEFEDIE